MNQLLKNLRVAVRLPAVSILALVALAVFAFGSFATLAAVKIGSDTDRKIAEHHEMLADIVPPAASLMTIDLWVMEAEDALSAGDATGLAEAVEEIEAAAGAFRERHAHWNEHATGPELEAFRAISEPGTQYLEVLETQFLPALEAGDLATVEAAENEMMTYVDIEAAAVERATSEIRSITVDLTTDATDLVDSRTTMLWALLLATLVVVGGAAWVVTRSVLRPLQELRRNMDDIATGDTDSADARLDAGRRDEFGQVAASFNAFADKLADSSREIERSAHTAQARAAEVSQAAGVAAENMNTVAVATTELSAAASEIARSAGDASRTADTAVRAADHANALMGRLADSSSQIGDVVETIRGIAAQTTMLALNATIEAARAGEAGRGFAVVASEVKDLAAETGTATTDIVGRVDQIQADTQAALVALAEVAQVITEISSSQNVIAAAVEEQAATTAEIDRSLTEAVTAVNQLAGAGGTAAPVAPDRFTTAA